jgi:hypothetical protein
MTSNTTQLKRLLERMLVEHSMERLQAQSSGQYRQVQQVLRSLLFKPSKHQAL